MRISEVNIYPVKPQDGLIAFASVVVDDHLYLSSIAVYTRLDGSYRLLYPTKKLGERILNLFHPISREASKQIEDAIFKKCYEILQRSIEDETTYGSQTI
jgi:stage V sporulation protein G